MSEKSLSAFLIEHLETNYPGAKAGGRVPTEAIQSQAIAAGYSNCTKQHVYQALSKWRHGDAAPKAKQRRAAVVHVETEEETTEAANPFEFLNLKIAEVQAVMVELGVERVVIDTDGAHIPLG